MSKRYSSLKSVTNGSKLFVNILFYGPHNMDFLDFLICANLNFNDFFSFPLTWNPMEVKIS